MKHKLTVDDVIAAVWGGAILGGGGGGFVARGEETARLALRVGAPELWSVDEFSAQGLTATVALVGAPAAANPLVMPTHLLRTVELLKQALPQGQQLVALHSNENGAETTVNGWFHSALTGLPVIDLACNGRAHPLSLMGSMGLHTDPDYLSIQAFAGGKTEFYLEGVAKGRLSATSGVVRRASVDAGGLVAVARNPVSISYANQYGTPGAINYAINLGRTYLDQGLNGVIHALGGYIAAEGITQAYQCEQNEGLDVGLIRLDDSQNTTLHFINEYMTIEQNGQQIASFPDLIMTFSSDGVPLASAEIQTGRPLRILIAPRHNLLLSRTMFMPELYRPLEIALGQSFAPTVN